MIPHERSLVEKLKDSPFALIGVNSDPKEGLSEKLKSENVSWRSFWDGGNTSGPIATRWNVSGWPTIYILDAKGVIRAKNLRGEEMEKKVMELLAELPAAPSPEKAGAAKAAGG